MITDTEPECFHFEGVPFEAVSSSTLTRASIPSISIAFAA